MSSPAKRMLPATGSAIRSTVWIAVVLPEPDSPTIASISPRSTLNDTPSTARTTCRGARRSVPTMPRGTGKCVTSPSTCSNVASVLTAFTVVPLTVVPLAVVPLAVVSLTVATFLAAASP